MDFHLFLLGIRSYVIPCIPLPDVGVIGLIFPIRATLGSYFLFSVPFLELFFSYRSHFVPSAGVEELGHLEMVGAIVHQLTRNMKDEQYKDPAFAPYFVDHTAGVYPASAAGTPWSAATMQVKGDPVTDLAEDMGAEEPIK